MATTISGDVGWSKIGSDADYGVVLSRLGADGVVSE